MDNSNLAAEYIFGLVIGTSGFSNELDNIIEKSESLNILGGRLTGAGFGGCCIFLINQNDTEQIFDTLSSHFSDIKFVDVI